MNKPAVVAARIAKQYRNKTSWGNDTECFWALKDISFDVTEGETLCILGESGSGKSTLAKILVGALEPDEGVLYIDNKIISKLSESKRLQHNRRIRMVFQDTQGSLNPSLTLGQILLEPLTNMTSLDPDEQQARIKKVINLVGLKEEYITRRPHSFSAGERQRIAIARALVMEPICIIADEPLSSLESSAQSQIINLMLDLQKDLGISFIIVTQDANVIKHMCDNVLVLCRGKIVEYGPADTIMNQPKHPYTQDFLDVNIYHPKIKTSATMDASMSACVYYDRCQNATDLCRTECPDLRTISDRIASCHHLDDNS